MSVGHNLIWWTRDESAEVFDLRSRADLSTLWEHYGGQHRTLLGEILGLAHEDRGARSVLAEYRYLDADYRSEHSRFYSTTFRRYPSVAHRLHFFSHLLPDQALDGNRPPAFADHGYLGYAVMRPVAAGPVGRTMLPPPDELEPFISCKTADTANVFGSQLDVPAAAPFMNQEAQLGVCVHITAWVCAYYHHLAYKHHRVLPADIAEIAPVESGRLIPARSMSIPQLAAILDGIGLPPIVYDLDGLPAGERVDTIACRYLNSGFPVIVAGGGHAFVLVGYRRVRTSDGGVRVQFIRQDDQRGPYDIVADHRFDRYKPWDYLVIPLPAKVYVSAEAAESVGKNRIIGTLERSADPNDAALLARIRAGAVVFRTTGMRSNDFKTGLIDPQTRPDTVVGKYQWTQMPRWIWATEAVDAQHWDAGEACVEAEAIIDATDHTGDPHALLWRTPGRIFAWDPDRDSTGVDDVELFDAVPTLARISTKVTETGNAGA